MGQRTATIPLSGSVTNDVDLRSARRIASIFVPTITSGDVIVRGSYEQSSGFAAIIHTQGSSADLRFPVGPGSCFIAWPQTVIHPPFIRLETSVPQAVAREFTVRFSSSSP